MSETRDYHGIATELAALRTLATEAERRMDEFWRRCERIEDRLAAIERAATCGIGPNEPVILSPAQADVGEVSESSKPTPGMLAAGRVLATNNYHGDPVGAAEEIVAHVGPELDTLRAENERLKDDYHVAVNNIAYRSEELVEANREIERLTSQLATSLAAAEAMEWLEKNTERTVLYGINNSTVKGWFVNGYFNGVYPTPTAAIIAARDAGKGLE